MNSLALRIALATPATVTYVGTATTGGTVAAGTQFYRVSAVMAVGGGGPVPGAAVAIPGYFETTTGTEGAGQVTTGALSTVTISWPAIPGATHYGVYGRATGAEKLMLYIPAQNGNVGTQTWIDTGFYTPSAIAVPVASNALAGNCFLPGGSVGYQAVPIQNNPGIAYPTAPPAQSPFRAGRVVTVANPTAGAIVVTGSDDGGANFSTSKILTPGGIVVTTMPTLSYTDIVLPNFAVAASAGLYIIGSA